MGGAPPGTQTQDTSLLAGVLYELGVLTLGSGGTQVDKRYSEFRELRSELLKGDPTLKKVSCRVLNFHCLLFTALPCLFTAFSLTSTAFPLPCP